MINYSRIKKIHFTGIGGAGMSGIAEVLFNMGFQVTGSDLSENLAVKRLKKMGVKVFLGHSAENICDAGTLVYSSAVSSSNVEVQEAVKRKMPVIPRAEMLAELMRMKYSISVAGTHGKTSTTSMIATILSYAHKDPTFVVGGKLKIEESGAKLGKSEYFVAEADESDGSFLKLFPTVAVITNIEDDHLDYYGSMDNLLEAFCSYGNLVPFYGAVIINNECSFLKKMACEFNKPVTSFGLDDSADIYAADIKLSVFKTSYTLWVRGEKKGQITLNTGGTHNVLNSLAAIAAAFEAGLTFEEVRDGLEHFYLPERRFQVLYYDDNNVVIDDYAHHPTEVKVTVDTLKSGEYSRIIGIFQPHRFSRLELLMDKFISSFDGIDLLIVSRIYAANQEEVDGVNGQVLVDRIKADGFRGEVIYIDDFDEITAYLSKELKPGDASVFLSAGNLTNYARSFASVLEGRRK